MSGFKLSVLIWELNVDPEIWAVNTLNFALFNFALFNFALFAPRQKEYRIREEKKYTAKSQSQEEEKACRQESRQAGCK